MRENQLIEVAGTDDYVSRGAHKLNAALDAFGIPVEGRIALDAGISTGGFTQVLLERGAARVIGVDVGHGQLSPLLATEERLTLVEGFNVRDMTSVVAGRGIRHHRSTRPGGGRPLVHLASAGAAGARRAQPSTTPISCC